MNRRNWIKLIVTAIALLIIAILLYARLKNTSIWGKADMLRPSDTVVSIVATRCRQRLSDPRIPWQCARGGCTICSDMDYVVCVHWRNDYECC